MISSSSDSCTKLVAGEYDVLLDENPAPVRKVLNEFLQRFERFELELAHQQAAGVAAAATAADGLDSSSYGKQFKQLRELSKTLKLDKENLKEGELDCNQRKNRYQDIIPFNHTRVVLQGDPSVPGSGYINANFVSGSSGSPRAYIACQGPLRRTVNDFWRMIWESNVSVVIMACNQFESGQSKCELYWPEYPNTGCLYGSIEVTLVKVRQICDDFLIRKFSVKLLQINQMMSDSGSISKTDSGSDDDRITRSDGDSDSFQLNPRARSANGELNLAFDGRESVVLEERTICQFHYTTWPDHGVPQSVQPILELLRLVRDVQPAEDKPILVHCSAGCGRTGTICCIDFVWGLLRRCRLESDFDLYQIISEMRRQRMSMVQTLEQYILCHRAVAALFVQQLSIMNDNDIYDTFEMNEVEEDTDKRAFNDVVVDDDDDDLGPVFI